MKVVNITLFVLTLFFCIIFSNATFAQGFGIKAGLNLAKFSGEDIGDVNVLMGFAFGGFVFWDINDNLRIQPELLVNIKGSEKEDPVIEKMDKISTKLTYLDIPVLIQYTIRTKGKFRPNIFAGPTLGWNIKAKMKLESGGDVNEEDLENINNIDFGIIFGVGGVLIDKITMDLRYSLGLISINDADRTSNEKNRVLSIMIGYRL